MEIESTHPREKNFKFRPGAWERLKLIDAIKIRFDTYSHSYVHRVLVVVKQAFGIPVIETGK